MTVQSHAVSNEAVTCVTCDRLAPETRKYDGWRWRCMAYPVPDIPHNLGPGIRGSHPWGRCLDKNYYGGRCPDWTPLRGKDNG